MNETYSVYVQTDENNNIITVNSSAFLFDIIGWTKIDEGTTDREHHAQGNYFDKPIVNLKGIYRYKLVNGKAVEKAEADITAEENAITKVIDKQNQIVALKIQLSATDYKVIKYSEYSLAGLPLPYNITELNTERQSLRDQINALEQQLQTV